MEVNQAFQKLKRYFSRQNIEGRETRYVVESAENSWMMPLPWFFAAAAYARDDNKAKFKEALSAAIDCYGEIISRNEPEAVADLQEQSDAAETLARNVEDAWKLVQEEVA
jgi:hypothetical protein